MQRGHLDKRICKFLGVVIGSAINCIAINQINFLYIRIHGFDLQIVRRVILPDASRSRGRCLIGSRYVTIRSVLNHFCISDVGRDHDNDYNRKGDKYLDYR